MGQATLEIPELNGKTVRCFSVTDSQLYGREVNVQFTDGTEVSLWIGVRQSVSAQCLDSQSGKVLFEREEQLAPPPQVTL